MGETVKMLKMIDLKMIVILKTTHILNSLSKEKK